VDGLEEHLTVQLNAQFLLALLSASSGIMRHKEVIPSSLILHTKDPALLTWLGPIPELEPFGSRYSSRDMLMANSALTTSELTEEFLKLRSPLT
jgi:hypothetical protein